MKFLLEIERCHSRVSTQSLAMELHYIQRPQRLARLPELPKPQVEVQGSGIDVANGVAATGFLLLGATPTKISTDGVPSILGEGPQSRF